MCPTPLSRFIEQAKNKPFSLLVSVARNQPDMARAAEEAGADSIKVHLNCKHPASGHLFRSFSKERKQLEKVVNSVSIPVGIVPGAEKTASLDELIMLKKMGFDFFDIFAHDMPLDYLQSELGKMVCVDSRYTPTQVKALEKCGAEIFEASVIPHEEYGKPIVFSDLIRWKSLTEPLSVPLLVSTQRKIKPEECYQLKQVGVHGIVIGVVVTGETTKGIERATHQFRKAIDAR